MRKRWKESGRKDGMLLTYIDWKQDFYDEVLSGKQPYESNLLPITK